MEDIHLCCEAIGLEMHAFALTMGRKKAGRAALEYRAALERKAQEFDAQAIALSKILFDAMFVVVGI